MNPRKQQRAIRRQISERAARVRHAVDEALSNGRLLRPGPRIEEILRRPIERYPDEILTLDNLPTLDGFKFLGWTANFDLIEVTQYVIDDSVMNSASEELVGWKPIRGNAILTGPIHAKAT